MSRIIVSCSVTKEQKEFIEENKLSPTAIFQQHLTKLMTGAYDEDREGMMDELVDRFFKEGKRRTFTQCKDWLKSPAWKDDLAAIGLTALGFMSICRKRVEAISENGTDPLLQYMVGIIDELPDTAVTVPGLSDARRRHIEHQAELASKWENDQEEQARDEAAE